MPEKIRILNVCPGLNWSSSERSALRDAVALRELGHESIFYVLRDSQLAYEASRAGLTCVFHTQGEAYGPLTWGRFLGVGQIIRKYEIQIVHGHFSGQLGGLWPLCYLVREWPMVPLVISCFAMPNRQHRGPLYRALAQRIDLCLSSGRDLVQELAVSLGAPLHKTEVEGPAIPESIPHGRGPLTIAAGLSGVETDPQALAPLFSAYSTLLKHWHDPATELPRLALVAPKKWEQNLLYSHLREMSQQEGIADSLLFLEGEGPAHVPGLALWIAHEESMRTEPMGSDEVQDHALEALLMGIPAIFPRRGPTMELIRDFPGIGETYRHLDGRDMMAKMAHVLKGRQGYHSIIQHNMAALVERYGVAHHRMRLLGHYRRLLQKRENFLRYRGKRRPESVNPS